MRLRVFRLLGQHRGRQDTKPGERPERGVTKHRGPIGQLLDPRSGHLELPDHLAGLALFRGERFCFVFDRFQQYTKRGLSLLGGSPLGPCRRELLMYRFMRGIGTRGLLGEFVLLALSLYL